MLNFKDERRVELSASKNRKNKFWVLFRGVSFYWMPVVLYAGFIFYLSSFSFDIARVESLYIDKFFHLGEYFLLGVLVSRAFKYSFPVASVIKYYSLVILFCSFYGISDEIHQFFVPYRDFSVADMFADFIGASLGSWVYRLRMSLNQRVSL